MTDPKPDPTPRFRAWLRALRNRTGPRCKHRPHPTRTRDGQCILVEGHPGPHLF